MQEEGVEERADPLVVIDIGGTTSDSGLLLPNGFPQMSSVSGMVCGVRTNFAPPAVESIGLGGGSIVRESPSLNGGQVTVGPYSIALELLSKARLFGGGYLTAVDIVAAAGIHQQDETNPFHGLGNRIHLANIPPTTILKAQESMREMIASLIGRTKTHKGGIDVLVVGGGACLIDTNESLQDVRSLRTVQCAEVADAVGAAISRVSGVIDTVVDTSDQTVRLQ